MKPRIPEVFEDPIVAEVREARAILAERFNFDFEAMIEDARARQELSGREVVSFPPKRIERPEQNSNGLKKEAA